MPGKNRDDDPDKPLTAREVDFVREFLVHGGGSAAVVAMGKAPGSARYEARRYLKRVRVRNAIRKAQTRAAERANITVDRILAEYFEIATADLSKETVPAMFAAKLHGKLRALNALSKHLGIGNDKLDEKVRAAVQEMLLRVRPRLEKSGSWVALLDAVEAEMGVPGLAAGATPAPEGGASSNGSAVH